VNTGDKPRVPCAKCGRVVAHSKDRLPLPHNCPAHGARCSHGQSGENVPMGSLPKPTCSACPPVTREKTRETDDAILAQRAERIRSREEWTREIRRKAAERRAAAKGSV
jgi:hypothetical protein